MENKKVAYHVCIQKSGSQWIKKIFEDFINPRKEIYNIVIPNKNFYNHKINKKIDFTNKIDIVTPLYMFYEDYISLNESFNHKAFYVIRDPRDLIVSRYFSNLYSHGEDEYIKRERFKLSLMTEKEALIYMITLMASMKNYFNSMIEWNKAASKNENVLIVKYEDLIGCDSKKHFRNVFNHLELKISDEELNKILDKNSFNNLAGRSQGEEDKKHHYRKGISGDWENYFEDIHKIIFKEIYGKELIELGYENDNDW